MNRGQTPVQIRERVKRKISSDLFCYLIESAAYHRLKVLRDKPDGQEGQETTLDSETSSMGMMNN